MRAAQGFLAVLFAVLILHPSALASANRLKEAQQMAAQGRFEEAVAAYENLAAQAETENDTNAQVTCLILAASCQQATGRYCQTFDNLTQAAAALNSISNSPELEMRLHAALGTAYAGTRKFAEGERLLRSALEEANQLRDDQARLSILQNLGNLLSARNFGSSHTPNANQRGTAVVLVPGRMAELDPLQEALKCYREALSVAQSRTDKDEVVRLLLNQIRTELKAGMMAEARVQAAQMISALRELPLSREKAFLEVSAAQCLVDLDSTNAALSGQSFTAVAKQVLEEARQIAESQNDSRIGSFAWGYEADILQRQNKLNAALACAQKALFLAQQAGNDDARFHWQWLVASILRDQGQRDRAITWYRLAVQTLQGRRADFYSAASLRGTATHFHDAISQVYYESADLLLQKAAEPGLGAIESKALVLEARQTIEMLKTVELEIFFMEDDCANLLKSKSRDLDLTVPGTASVYIIPLATRTEILVSVNNQIRRLQSPATATQIVAASRNLREQLEQADSQNYISDARKLWSWLIEPMEPVLKQEGVTTLIFVPDATLRGLPMAALRNDTRFLIEDYTLVVSPGLTLLSGSAVSRKETRALVCGVSKAVQNHPKLEWVPAELHQVQSKFKSTVLLDEDFQIRKVRQELGSDSASIVHIASHAHFGGDAQQSYILAFDGRLTLDMLEEMIRPRLLSSRPIDLLTLSACETAAGDEQAPLGLAGVAIKSGARSTLATLWPVNDEATQVLMGAFYKALNKPGQSKAQALRSAQCELMRQEHYRHPFYWSPYIMIGDWR